MKFEKFLNVDLEGVQPMQKKAKHGEPILDDVVVYYKNVNNKLRLKLSFSQKVLTLMGNPKFLAISVKDDLMVFSPTESTDGYKLTASGNSNSRKYVSATVDTEIFPKGRYEITYSASQDVYFIKP